MSTEQTLSCVIDKIHHVKLHVTQRHCFSIMACDAGQKKSMEGQDENEGQAVLAGHSGDLDAGKDFVFDLAEVASLNGYP